MGADGKGGFGLLSRNGTAFQRPARAKRGKGKNRRRKSKEWTRYNKRPALLERKTTKEARDEKKQQRKRVKCCVVNTRLFISARVVKLRVAFEDLSLVVAQKTNGQQGEDGEGDRVEQQLQDGQETHTASCLAHCLSVLPLSCNSLVCYSVCNCTKDLQALRHSHPSRASTSQATNKSLHPPQTPPLQTDQQKPPDRQSKNVKITTRLGYLCSTSRQRHTTRALEKGHC